MNPISRYRVSIKYKGDPIERSGIEEGSSPQAIMEKNEERPKG